MLVYRAIWATTPSAVSTNVIIIYDKESRTHERIPKFNRVNFTSLANIAQHAGTASMLNTAEPTMVPTPKSPSVMKVPMTLMNNSGLELAAAITVAPATSSVTLSSVVRYFTFVYVYEKKVV